MSNTNYENFSYKEDQTSPVFPTENSIYMIETKLFFKVKYKLREF